MSFAAHFNLGGGEIILVLALVLILFASGKLPALADRFGRDGGTKRPEHLTLMILTFALGLACVAMLVYELSK